MYDECGADTKINGRQVYEIEYPDIGSAAYTTSCARGRSVSIVYRERDVVPRGAQGSVDKTC